MKRGLFLLCCMALLANGAEIGIFPEKMVYPMAGFDKWLCGKDAITAMQTRGYSWSSAIRVKLDASKITAFNVELAADCDLKSKLTIYFRREGEKGFHKECFSRSNFNASANTPQVVTVPMKNKHWKGVISAFRFDLSGKKGANWKISRIWFTGDESAVLAPVTANAVKVKKSKPVKANENANISSDIVVFPGKQKIYPLVGFKSFTQQSDCIVAEHSQPYAYTAVIPVNIRADKYKFFNCLIESPNNVSGNFTIYYMRKGEKSFKSFNYRRTSFSLAAGKSRVISIPLGGSWKGSFDRIRFDFSAKSGQKWSIRKLWFSKKLPENFKNKDFEVPVKLGSTPVKLVEKRYDLLEGREYRFALRSKGNAQVKTTVSFYNDTDECIGKKSVENISADGMQELLFSLPESTTYTVLEMSASGKSGDIIDDFKFAPTARRTGANWQASWICHPQARKTLNHSAFIYSRSFELPEMPIDGRIQLTADDGYILKINGKDVGKRLGGWQQTAYHDVTSLLKAGRNDMEITVVNENGPTAFIAELRCEMADGKIILIKTDKEFSVRQSEGKGALAPAAAALELGVPPIAPWHSVAYNTLHVRRKLEIVRNGLVFKDGKITGRLQLKDFADPVLPVLLTFPGGVSGKYLLPVKNSCVDFNIDLKAAHLLPGDYDVVADSSVVAGENHLLKVSIPKQAPEANIAVKMVQKNGYLQAELDGKPLWFSGFRARRASQRQRAYHDGNYRIILYGVSKGGSDGSNSGRSWLGPGRYDFAQIEAGLENFFKIYPETKIIITYGIDAPKWWCDAHPDECVWFEGKNTPEGLTSLASRKWRDEGKAAFRAFVRYFEKSKYASKILGYRIQAHCSGGEFQYLGTWQRKYADYSPAMKRYFRAFLKERYGSDAKLQKAWNNPSVTLADAEIPTGKERKAAELGMFRDLDKARNVADFVDCLSDSMVTGAMEFLKIVREEAPNKLAGLYGGYVYYYSGYQLLNSAHVNFGKLYRSRLADFISSPHDYIQRKVGWPGGHHGPVVGTSLYNLSWWDENDTRTILCAPGGHRHVDSMHETIGVLKRDLILQVTKGVGNVFYDLAGGWFDHPGIMEALRKTNLIGKFALSVPGFKRGQAAVLYSTESIKRLAESNNAITIPLRQDMRRNLGWSGITTDQYLLEDILQDNFPEYDCYILPNVYAPSEKVRKAIQEKLMKNGKLVIFGYAPGAFRENSGKIDLKAMKELTGINFACAPGKVARSVTGAAGKFGSGVPVSPAFYVNDKSAKPMGVFAASKRVAVAAKKLKSGASVVVTMVPEMTPAIYRELFRKHGIHILTETEDPVYYDGRFIAIHANTSGEKVLSLPEAREWFDLFRNKAVSGKSKTLKLNMERGQTEIFFIGSKADAERYQKTAL